MFENTSAAVHIYYVRMFSRLCSKLFDQIMLNITLDMSVENLFLIVKKTLTICIVKQLFFAKKKTNLSRTLPVHVTNHRLEATVLGDRYRTFGRIFQQGFNGQNLSIATKTNSSIIDSFPGSDRLRFTSS